MFDHLHLHVALVVLTGEAYPVDWSEGWYVLKFGMLYEAWAWGFTDMP